MFHSSKIIKYFFILHLFYSISNCQLTIPLTYFPVNKYNNTTPTEIMKSLVLQRVYANIDIGTPRQTTQLPLIFDSNDFYIGYAPLKSLPEGRFRDMKCYNYNSSTLNDTDMDSEDYYSYNGDMFVFGTYQRDNFYFKDKTYQIEFYLVQSYKEVDSGGIGLQLMPSGDYDSAQNIKKTFFGKIKKHKLVNNYYWSIFYNSKKTKKEEEGTILLGCLPHEYNGNLGFYKEGCFKEENIKTINLEDISLNKINMDGVYAYEGSNGEKLIEDFPNGLYYKSLELDYHSGGVKVPKNLQKFYHRIFEEHIKEGNCFNETAKGRDYLYYYCKKNNQVLSKIKNAFPKIVYMSRDLTYNFTLDYDDLFLEEKDYVFFLMYFNTYTDSSWKMGKPFLRKYVFVFNYDKKNVDFYLNVCSNTPKQKNSGISIMTLVVIIIGTVIIVLIVGFLVFQFCIYDKLFRKKRANELDDADFEYISKEDENNKLGV